MLELIVLAQESIAKRALKDSTSMRVNIAITLETNGVLERARAGVSLKTSPTVAHKRFTEITNRTNHAETDCED